MHKKLFAAIVLLCFAAMVTVDGVAYAQGAATDNLAWFSWTLFVTYAALGAFGSFIHDWNDGNGIIILPHQISPGRWDLGFITPAVFGAVAGFFALAVPNVPFLQGLFPEIQSLQAPGAFSAFLAGYLWSKTIAVALSNINITSSTSSSATAKPAS